MNEHPIDCQECVGRLPLFAGGELGGAARSEVEVHLAGCSGCGQQFARITAARESLRSGLARGLSRSPDLWPAVRAGLIHEGLVVGPREPAAPAPVMRSFPLSRRFLVRAAAALVLVSLGAWWFAHGGGALSSENDPAPPVARNSPAATTPLFAQPVGLHRVPLNVSPLSESAEVYTEEWNRVESLSNPHASSSIEAAGLHTVPNLRQH